MYKKVVLFSIVLLFFPLVLSAQQPPTPQEMEKERARMEQEMKKMQEEMKKRQEEELKRLKEIDPQSYKARVAFLERQEKISKIITDFHQEKISEKAAKKKLRPLVKENMQSYIKALPENIERLQKQLDFLTKVEKNTNLLIDKRIDQMLGLEAPQPQDYIY